MRSSPTIWVNWSLPSARSSVAFRTWSRYLPDDPAAGQVRGHQQLPAVVADGALGVERPAGDPGADGQLLGQELVDGVDHGGRLRHRRIELGQDRGQGFETIDQILGHVGFHSGPGRPSRARVAVHPGPTGDVTRRTADVDAAW